MVHTELPEGVRHSSGAAKRSSQFPKEFGKSVLMHGARHQGVGRHLLAHAQAVWFSSGGAGTIGPHRQAGWYSNAGHGTGNGRLPIQSAPLSSSNACWPRRCESNLVSASSREAQRVRLSTSVAHFFRCVNSSGCDLKLCLTTSLTRAVTF